MKINPLTAAEKTNPKQTQLVAASCRVVALAKTEVPCLAIASCDGGWRSRIKPNQTQFSPNMLIPPLRGAGLIWANYSDSVRRIWCNRRRRFLSWPGKHWHSSVFGHSLCGWRSSDA